MSSFNSNPDVTAVESAKSWFADNGNTDLGKSWRVGHNAAKVGFGAKFTQP